MSEKFDLIIIFFNLWLILKPDCDAWSVKLTFLLTVSFYLTKTGIRTKKSLTQFSYC